jgi:hypothetical protein
MPRHSAVAKVSCEGSESSAIWLINYCFVFVISSGLITYCWWNVVTISGKDIGT